MLVCEITKSTPGEIKQVDLIADLTEEEYLEFEGMCGYCFIIEVSWHLLSSLPTL